MTEQAASPTVESITAEWAIRPVTYNATLSPRMTPMLDESGNPVVTKKGETRMRLLSYEIPLDLRVGTYDQWTELFEHFGRDPHEAFAEIVNDVHKQKQESKKGDARKEIIKQAKTHGLNDKKITNAELLASLEAIPSVQKEIAAFATACRTNFPGAPRPATQRAQEKETLAKVEKIDQAAPGLIARLASFTDDQLAAFLANPDIAGEEQTNA